MVALPFRKFADPHSEGQRVVKVFELVFFFQVTTFYDAPAVSERGHECLEGIALQP